jgi:hypothetical protein
MSQSRTVSPRTGSPTAKTMGRPHEFFRRGVQYYVMARQAFGCRYPEVAGSLFHQAFEMMLKASILSPLHEELSPGWEPEEPEAKRRAAIEEYTRRAGELLTSRSGIGHELPEAWRQFKALHPGDLLDAFDDVVDDLHEWWQVRYPGFPNGQALQLSFSPVKAGRPATEQPEPVNGYHLCLEDMDEFFAAIAPLDYSLHGIRSAVDRFDQGVGVEAYQQDNLHRLW